MDQLTWIFPNFFLTHYILIHHSALSHQLLLISGFTSTVCLFSLSHSPYPQLVVVDGCPSLSLVLPEVFFLSSSFANIANRVLFFCSGFLCIIVGPSPSNHFEVTAVVIWGYINRLNWIKLNYFLLPMVFLEENKP